jgi:N-acetylmuramoyl-L-alanine amidase
MRIILRTAAFAAAFVSICAGLAGPALAQTEAVAALAFVDHGRTVLTGEGLGLNEVENATFAVPASEDASPVAVHAIAPVLPESILDRLETPTPRREGRALADLVADYGAAETPDAESECLARAVYWESRGEPLAGQLAVAEVIINRSRSGRFVPTICGVVRQRSQFSFVRGGHIPEAPRATQTWRNAVAIARIAVEEMAEGAAPRALFFHARRINPGWRLTRVATVGNHVFYR